MAKITMLGTGNGGTMDLYNTCFIINNKQGNLLVDTGGSIEIIRRLKKADVELNDLKHIFISHSHTDHILGLIWMFKKIGVKIMHGEIEDKINVYCNDEVYDAIKNVSSSVLPKKLNDLLKTKINYVILKEHDIVNINGVDYEFFHIPDTGSKLFGFKCTLDGKTLTFYGDVTFKTELSDIVKNSDYVMHEAFCLESEENIFHAYEKHHSTVKHACEMMNDLNVRNLILYHTEETHGLERKRLYEDEGKQYFNGNIVVPDDMEEIIIK